MISESNLTHSNFKNRSDLHVARKLWHVFGVLIIFLGWMIFPFSISIAILTACAVVFVPTDLWRQKNPKVNKLLTKFFQPIMRKSEIDRLAGTTYLLLGVIVIAIVFNRGVVSLSLLFLALADPIASYIGIKYGKDKIFGHKSVQGFIAAFCVCAVVTYTYLFYNNVHEHILIASILAGLVGALAELVPIGRLDDNFSMPILSGLGLSVLFYFFGFYPFFA